MWLKYTKYLVSSTWNLITYTKNINHINISYTILSMIFKFSLWFEYALISYQLTSRTTITYIVCWYKTLYQVEPVEPVSLRVAISCDAVSSRNRQDLYQHTMYVISLPNISIKKKFKQITRVKLKFVQYSEGDYISCMTSRYNCRSFNDDATVPCFLSL
jgi:hypothetical protein